jgi:hypothetical protein
MGCNFKQDNKMTDLKKSEQRGGGRSSGTGAPRDGDEPSNRGAEFGTSERGTRGKNRDFDESGESMNQGHGHTREETQK